MSLEQELGPSSEVKTVNKIMMEGNQLDSVPHHELLLISSGHSEQRSLGTPPRQELSRDNPSHPQHLCDPWRFSPP